MTKRITVSVPDHVAARLDREPNVSAYVTRCVENEIRGETSRRIMAEHGMVITDEGIARARERMRRALARETPEQRRERQRYWEDAREAHGLPRRPNLDDR